MCHALEGGDTGVHSRSPHPPRRLIRLSGIDGNRVNRSSGRESGFLDTEGPLLGCRVTGSELKRSAWPTLQSASSPPGEIRGVSGDPVGRAGMSPRDHDPRLLSVSAPTIGLGRLRGRDAELELLLRRVDGLKRGRGGVTVIRGAAGLGKSSLLAAAEKQARDAGVRVFHGQATFMGDAVPFAPLLDALVTTDDSPVDVGILRQLSGSADQRFWVLRELEERLERAALDYPLMIGLDDVQWADPATLIAISVLPKRLAYDRIAWLFSVRTGELGPPAQAALTQINSIDPTILTLDRLDDDAVVQVCEDLLEGAPDATVTEAVSGALGHPFLLVELLRGLIDEGLVEIEDGEARVPSQRIPRRLLDSVDVQIAALTGETRHALQMASVLGGRFSVDELAAVMDRPSAALLGPVREAIGAGLIIEDGERLSFRHDLVRESIDASLPMAFRRALQRRALDVMLEHGAPPSDVARLVIDVAQPGDLPAIEMLRRAAAEIARVSPVVAAPLSRRALELTPRESPLYGELVEETVGLLVSANLASEAMQLIATVTPGLIDPLAEARARFSVVPMMMQYEASEAVNQCRLALQLPRLPATLRTQLLSFMASSLELLGETQAAAAAATDAVSIPGVADDPAKLMVTSLPRALITFADGDWRQALVLAAEAIQEQAATQEYASWHLWLYDGWNAVILLAAGYLDQAVGIIEAGARVALNDGIAVNMRIWSMLRCRLLLYQGRLADARAEADAVLQMSDELGEGARGYVNRIALYTLATVATHTGDPTALREGRRAALSLLSNQDSPTSMRTGAWILARLDAVEGETKRSDSLTAHTLDPLTDGPLRASDPRQHSDGPVLIHMLLDNDKAADAADVAHSLEDALERSPDFPFLSATVAHASALVQRDAALAETAASLYDGCPQPLVRALALEDAGALLPPNRATDAVNHLDAALDIYTSAGAERDAARVRGLLRTRGVRRSSPNARSSSRWPELSESEMAVVELVARGGTNREVADQLYLSPHTINAHLRHVFAKLGIRSRIELARLAVERST
jgi:DNA-binding CsgD family transcriptional regulator